MKHQGASRPARSRPFSAGGFSAFQLLVVVMLAAIALGVAYIALRDPPGAKLLRAADQLIEAPHQLTPEAMRKTAASLDITILLSALQLYKFDNKRYPSEAEGLATLTASPRRYLQKLPTDPWGRPYQFANPGKKGEIDVFSRGPDGVPGTEDDLGSWQQ